MDDAERQDLEERNAAARLLRAKNGNLRYPNYPADALAMLKDPRLEGMVDRPQGIPNVRALRPSVITREESKYLKIQRGFAAQPSDNARWVNEACLSFLNNGRGLGFEKIEQRPRIEQPKAPPKKLFHFWEYHSFFVASPDVLDLLRAASLSAITSVPIEWVFSDGQALEGYEFVDVIAMHDAYDYQRSVVNVELRNGRMIPQLGYDRALRQDIPAGACVFRDNFHRHDVFVTRELAAEISRFASREVSFHDVQTHRNVEFARTRPPRTLKARLKREQWPTDDSALPLDRRLSLRVIPLIRSGHFAEAETLLTGWIRALPTTPFHVITDLAITTPLERCAEFFNEFATRSRRAHKLKAVYAEMNGFAINPDLWFCDAFGFSFDGGDDGHDWLGDFGSSSDESLVIEGLEPAQEVFARWVSSDASQDELAARRLAEALVITKFQGWLQRSLAHMTPLKCPFWATAHDYYEYLGKVGPLET